MYICGWLVKRLNTKDDLVNIIFLFAFLVILFIIFNLTVSGDTISVDDSGGADYTSIQDAINNANESDNIQVASGTYNENIFINKALMILGSGKDNTKIIGLDDQDNTVRITANNVFFSGFSVDNSVGQNGQYHCVFLQGSTDCVISENIMKNGEYGIYLYLSNNNTIQENSIRNNNQKGLRLSNSNENNIINNDIQSNGDGVYLSASSSNEIFDNKIINNGVGVFIGVGSIDNYIYLNDFDDNTAGHAEDSGSNYWSKNQQGNYWDNYDDYDLDENGIGDSPYMIDDNSIDYYPMGDFLTYNEIPEAFIDSISPNPSVHGETVSFHGHGVDDGDIVSWEWKSSKNGVLGTSAHCTHSSLSIGVHTITFRVKDDENKWSQSDSITLTIQSEISDSSNERPIASIASIDPMQINISEEIEFIGIGNDIDGLIVGYQWRSSIDGVLSQEDRFTTTELSEGNHMIYFKVKDNNETWSIEDTMIIKVLDPTKPQIQPVSYLLVPSNGTVNSTILFDGSNSYDQDGTIETYKWDFGDNTTGNGKIITHIYKNIDTYTVSLTVTDNNGNSDTNSTSISIEANNTSNTNNNDESDTNTPSFEFNIFVFSLIFIYLIIRKNRLF
jgi:parallel beta-helix repeat protein